MSDSPERPTEMQRYRRIAKHTLLSSRPCAAFLRFVCVGLTMAIVDISLLYLLKHQSGFNSYTGGLLNLGIYSLVVFLAERAELTRFWYAVMPLLGVWLGGIVGMCFNFLLSRSASISNRSKTR